MSLGQDDLNMKYLSFGQLYKDFKGEQARMAQLVVHGPADLAI